MLNTLTTLLVDSIEEELENGTRPLKMDEFIDEFMVLFFSKISWNFLDKLA